MANIGLKRDAFYTLVHTLNWKLRRPPMNARGEVSAATKARLGVAPEVSMVGPASGWVGETDPRPQTATQTIAA
jgi:hypothetical protein